MVSIRRMTEEDAAFVVACNAGTDRRFLTQWSGDRCYTFPLTERQVVAHMRSLPDAHFFAVCLDGRMIGACELGFFNWAEKKGMLCRFLLAAQERGKGHGAEALRLVTDYAFSQLGLERVGLRVYAYNMAAVRCYQKAGFVERDRTLRPGGETAIYMEKRSDAPTDASIGS